MLVMLYNSNGDHKVRPHSETTLNRAAATIIYSNYSNPL